MDAYWLPFGWGLLVLLSFLGWGTAVERGLAGTTADWGLRCGWGIAVTITIGGILASFSLASRRALILMVTAGAAIGLWGLVSRRIPNSRIWLPGAVAMLAVMAFWYAPTVSLPWHNGCDDDVAYFPFVRRLLDSGTLLEPFSLRRLATFGGQSLLQALIVSMGSEKNVHLLDIGIGGVVLAGIAYGAGRRLLVNPANALAIAAAALLMPVPRLNSMSQTTGLVLFLTLFQTIHLVFRSKVVRAREIVCLGMLAAAICTLRDNYIPAAILALAGCFVADPRIGALRARIACGASACLAALLFLVPWMVILQRSSGSWLYPLIRGNHQRSFETYSAGFSRFDALAAAAGFFTHFETVIILAPAILLAFSARDRIAFAQIASGTATAWITAFLFTYTDNGHLYRYSHAYLLAALLASLFAAIQFRREKSVRGRLPAHVFSISLAVLLVGTLPVVISGQGVYLRSLKLLPAQIRDIAPLYPPGERDAYRRLQSLVPEHASVLAMTAAPALFDYRRNFVLNLDIPGAASPSPGMPFFKGPEALKAYLKNLGIGYIAYSDFDSAQCLYDRQRWLCQMDSTRCVSLNPAPAFCDGSPAHPVRSMQPMDGGTRLAALWKVHGVFYLDLMQNIDRLAETEGIAFCGGQLRLLRLK
jgi:hypothetical protein